jgi:hypothetical protein
LQHFSRCERTQHEVVVSELGSNPPFAGARTNDRNAGLSGHSSGLVNTGDKHGHPAMPKSKYWIV